RPPRQTHRHAEPDVLRRLTELLLSAPQATNGSRLTALQITEIAIGKKPVSKQSIHPYCQQKNRADKRVALEKRAVNCADVQSLSAAMLVNQRHQDQRHRAVINYSEFCSDAEKN